VPSTEVDSYLTRVRDELILSAENEKLLVGAVEARRAYDLAHLSDVIRSGQGLPKTLINFVVPAPRTGQYVLAGKFEGQELDPSKPAFGLGNLEVLALQEGALPEAAIALIWGSKHKAGYGSIQPVPGGPALRGYRAFEIPDNGLKFVAEKQALVPIETVTILGEASSLP